MTDPSTARDEAEKPAQPEASWTKLAVDFGPVLVFMVVYNVIRGRVREAREACEAAREAANGAALTPDMVELCARADMPIYVATGVFIVATLAAVAYSWVSTRKVSPMLIISAVLVTAFGLLTILLNDPIFIKIKPTVVNLLFAAGIFGSLLVGHNALKLLLGEVYQLPENIWRVLALRWGAFFIFLAILNELIWRNFSEAFWVGFKFWGVLPITMAFAVANVPLILRHQQDASPARSEG